MYEKIQEKEIEEGLMHDYVNLCFQGFPENS